MLVSPSTDPAANPEHWDNVRRQIAQANVPTQEYPAQPGNFTPQQDIGPYPGWNRVGAQPLQQPAPKPTANPAAPARSNWQCMNCGTVVAERRVSAQSPSGVEWPCPKCGRILSQALFEVEGEPDPLPQGFVNQELPPTSTREFPFWRHGTPGKPPALCYEYVNQGRRQPMQVDYGEVVYPAILALLETCERQKALLASCNPEEFARQVEQARATWAANETRLREALLEIEGLKLQVGKLTAAEKELSKERDELSAKMVIESNEVKQAYKEAETYKQQLKEARDAAARRK